MLSRGSRHWFGALIPGDGPGRAGARYLPQPILDERVDAVTNAREYHGAHWGILVVDAATGRTVFERNPDQLFCPASVTKLFTTAAALVDLGANYSFRTPVVPAR